MNLEGIDEKEKEETRLILVDYEGTKVSRRHGARKLGDT